MGFHEKYSVPGSRAYADVCLLTDADADLIEPLVARGTGS
jgi:hypothetical protein